MEYVRVVNWEKFQHYGFRRNPPWIRLYNSLLENYRWGLLSDVSKAHLVGLFLLASRTGNRLPADPTWLGRRMQAREPVNLAELLDCGFLEAVGQDVSPNASADKSRGEEIRAEERRAHAAKCSGGAVFAPPTVEEVAAFAASTGYPALDAAGFVARYGALGWRLGETPIRDWRPLVERWRSREGRSGVSNEGSTAGAVGKRLMVDIAHEEGVL